MFWCALESIGNIGADITGTENVCRYWKKCQYVDIADADINVGTSL